MRPVRVPPVEAAWGLMARRLDERMPVVRRPSLQSLWVGLFATLFVAVPGRVARVRSRPSLVAVSARPSPRAALRGAIQSRCAPPVAGPHELKGGAPGLSGFEEADARPPAPPLGGFTGAGPQLGFEAGAARRAGAAPNAVARGATAVAAGAGWRMGLGLELRVSGAGVAIPGPYLRVRANERMYVQAGIRFRAAVNTPRMRIDSTADSSKIRGWQQDIQGTGVTLTKLYYLEAPVSVHYRVVDGLWAGAGVQYGRLTGGRAWQDIVMYPTSGAGPNARPTDYSAGYISLKDNAHAYAKIRPTDWRAVLDVRYTWRRFTLGVDYQRGLGTYVADNRNSSWGLSLGYAFTRSGGF